MLLRNLSDLARQSGAALRVLVVLTVVLGIVYPVAVWVVGLAIGDRAHGQPVRLDGQVVGSRLLGQGFTGEEWFHSRPSANDYDALASGPSNLGPTSDDLHALIEERRTTVAAAEGVDPGAVPADALTASGSGLDPDISPEYAALQAPRVAETHGLELAEVEALIDEHTTGRFLGFVGQRGVNVLELNLDVREAAH
jgi:K+-transporting ATPase ATPase C chain